MTTEPKPTQWAIISPGDGTGFVVVPIIREEGYSITYEIAPHRWRSVDIASLYIVARHTNKAEAEDGLTRAQAAEKIMRPMWQASVEHEIRCRSLMQAAVALAAKPLERKL